MAPLQFGLYVPQPNISVGSREIVRSVVGALAPLPSHEVDPAFELSRSVLCAADAAGFDIILFAERHLGPDLEAWVMASAIGAATRRIRSMVAVHPGLWHPTLIAKMAASLDRISSGRMAINLVTGWNEVEHRMFGGSAMPKDDDRYVRAEEYIEILRGLWTTTPFSYRGRFYRSRQCRADAAAGDAHSTRYLHSEPERARPRHGGEACRLVVRRFSQDRADAQEMMDSLRARD